MQTREEFLEVRRKYHREHTKKVCGICGVNNVSFWMKNPRCRSCYLKTRKGIKNPNSIKAISGWWKGKHLSLKRRKYMSEIMKGRRCSPRTEFKDGHSGMRGKENPLYKHGQTGTKEYHAKMNGVLRKKKLIKMAGRPMPENCELCGILASEVKRWHSLCFDHDHKTGKFRGWICYHCNIALAMVKDNPEIADKVAAYLRKDAPDCD